MTSWSSWLRGTPRSLTTLEDWLACTHPAPMLAFLERRISQRKLLLFACASVHCICPQVIEERCLTGFLASAGALDAKKAGIPFSHFTMRDAGATWSNSIDSLLNEIPQASSERRFQADLLRHITGNPYRPFEPSASWPSTVTVLANALYNGEDCHYALADALMEAGHVELAEHFQDPGHPKGCWAMDAILGKS